MVSAVRTHPCHQPSYTKQRQVLAEEEEEALLAKIRHKFVGSGITEWKPLS